jgi:hypothetical protein
MATKEQKTEYGSFARFFGENSMEAWTRTLLENRHCMDCKVVLEDIEGAMVLRGWIPHIELVGHLCDACWVRREEMGHYLFPVTTR